MTQTNSKVREMNPFRSSRKGSEKREKNRRIMTTGHLDAQLIHLGSKKPAGQPAASVFAPRGTSCKEEMDVTHSSTHVDVRPLIRRPMKGADKGDRRRRLAFISVRQTPDALLDSYCLRKTLFVIICALATAYASKEWEDFKTKYGKTYANPVDEQYRESVFQDKLEYIEETNKLYEKGLLTYYLKINKYSDLTHKELMDQMTGGLYMRTAPPKDTPSEVSVEGLAEEVDWRAKGAVSPVKDQGECGSCYAFSAVSSLESMLFIKTGQLVDLSEQNLVDCASDYSCFGCRGGFPYGAYIFLMDQGGIATEESYPYAGAEQDCMFDAASVGAVVKSYVEPTSESKLQQAVHDDGPVSVYIDANHPTFGSYGGGVYIEPNCDSLNANLAVSVVGYGVENGLEYWLVRNAWGESWGEEGYIKMAKNAGNMCAISTHAIYPVV
ncbi:crustapain-like [Macrobrachium nipponense]|uniref:crustapain-like n=1 Tax=Macrobrachium nipponense TaxID=159736 RepID=UPI0030C8C6E9